MSDIRWIKLSTSMFDDEKIDFIMSLPDCDAILVIWVRLLTMAGRCNAGGFLMLTEKIPYTDEMLVAEYEKRGRGEVARNAIETFLTLDMIDLSEERGIIIPELSKYIIPILTTDGRNSPEYLAWRYAVLDRDGFCCVRCRADDKPLHAHHKVRWVDSVDLRFELENGITLCVDCHKEEHRVRPPRKPATIR